MNYVELFAGILGFGLALDRAGHTCVAIVEKDKACQGVIRRHKPNVPLFDDATTFGKKDVTHAVDIVCGGSPCQSFSVAGLRKSLADQRGNLAFEFCRIVNELKPAYVIWENVPGVLNTKDNAFGCFLAALVGEDTPIVPHGGRWTNAGLVAGPERSAAWRVLDAQYFGVAQRRRRVFVVASAASAERRCDEILFECEGVRRDTAPSRQTRESVARFAPSGFGNYDPSDVAVLRSNHGGVSGGTEAVVVKIDNTKSNGWGVLDDGTTHSLGGSTDAVVYDARGNGTGDIAPNVTGACGEAAGESHANRITDYTPVVVQQNARDEVRLVGGDGQIAGAISAEAGMHQQNYVVQQNAVGDPDTANSVGGKVRGNFDNQDDTAIVAFDWQHGGDANSRSSIVRNGEYATLRATTTPAIMHNATVRRLTPVECERLQAFPDGWTEHGMKPDGTEYQQADTPRYKQLGNAVCVNVVEFIARRIPA